MSNTDNKGTIIVVDDTPDNLALLEDILQSQGYTVLLFPGAELAIQAARKSTPDIVLLDIMMPGMDGFAACKELKSIETMKDVPIIFISALDDTENKIKAFEKGAVDYITKPFQESEVLARISVHLELNNQKKEIKSLLNETMIGAIQALNELLAIANPQAYRKTLTISQHMRTFTKGAGLKNAWMYNVAAHLMNLAAIRFESEPIGFEKIIEQQSFHSKKSHQEVFNKVADIIRKIPRLNIVSSMIEHIIIFPKTDEHWTTWNPTVLGGHLLRICFGLENRLQKGFSVQDAFWDMAYYAENPYVFHSQLLHDFALISFDFDISDRKARIIDKRNVESDSFLEINSLKPGMVLAEDLTDSDGLFILNKGTELTVNLLAQIQQLYEMSPKGLSIKVQEKADRNIGRNINESKK